MMSLLWSRLCNFVSKLFKPSRRRTHVRFSPSTVKREIERSRTQTCSTNPFFIFLAEFRANSIGNNIMLPGYAPTATDNRRLTKTAAHVWKRLSDEEKEPYRKIALEQQQRQRRPRETKRQRADRLDGVGSYRKRKKSCYGSPHGILHRSD